MQMYRLFSPKSLFFNSFFLLIFLYFGIGRGRAQACRLQRPHNQRFWNLQWFAGYIVGIWKAFIQLAPGEEKHGTRLEKRAFSSINLHGNIKSQARTRSLLSRLWMLARPPSLFLPTPPPASLASYFQPSVWCVLPFRLPTSLRFPFSSSQDTLIILSLLSS